MEAKAPATNGCNPADTVTTRTTPREGLALLAAAAVLGVAGDVLLRVGPPGVNGAVWLAAFLAAVALLRRWLIPAPRRAEAAATAVALPFALALAWRDAGTVKLLDLAVVGTMVALSFLRPLGARPLAVTMTQLGEAGALAGLHATLGAPVLVASDVRWGEVRWKRWSSRPLAAVRGVALAVPLLAAFGALLAAADAVFARLLGEVLRIDVWALASHLVVAFAFAWVAGGALRGTLLMRPTRNRWSDLPRAPRLGIIEVGVALGLLDALFLAFVAVQIRYLFGGARYLSSLPALTYAEYARQGFFQLVAVAALAIPLLLAAHWLLRRESARDERAYRALAAVMAVLLAVMMASAVRRMLLYTSEYGLSELRVYTLAFMGWLALVLAWFSATVLTGRRERFAFGAMAAGVAVVAVLNVANPDALIARVNLARAAATGRFDATFAATLSADATPALVAGLPALDAAQRATLVSALAHRWRRIEEAGWRPWSLSRASAVRALERGPSELRAPAAGDGGSPDPPDRGRRSAREQ